MSTDEGRARAINALDKLLAATADAPPPDMDGAREVFEAVVALRDGLAARLRVGEPVADELARANAALAFAWSGTVPAAGFRPGRLQKARAVLANEGA